jgi:RecJ-like exonuclease
MSSETCGICGGDGRIANSFSGTDARCPACHGTGRKSEEGVFHDVTKTKPSHYRQTNKAGTPVEKPNWPSTFEGGQLANEVKDCPGLSNDTKTKLTREIMDHEATHGKCTQTFIKKIRKQVRPAVKS